VTDPSGQPTNLQEAMNRAVNLVAATVLGLTALTFGSEIFNEMDPVDKIDNTLLLVIGVVAVAWYFMRRNWARRSALPVVLAGAALIAQIAGFAIEVGDSVALGDDIPGLVLFVPLLIIVFVLYRQAAPAPGAAA
jgi:peptidoglycan/LPS O-acetylase OafA/YrhL